MLLETSKGDIVIDLFCEQCPIACKNFIKLCKTKYYNFSLFHKVVPGTVVQTGDPTGTGTGGSSIYGELFGEQAKYFEDEIHRKLRHDKAGCVSMSNSGPNTNGSQFFITVSDGQNHLDDKYTLFGVVAEGLEVVQELSNVYADGDGRPYQNTRIRHTIILEDPFDDPPGLQVGDPLHNVAAARWRRDGGGGRRVVLSHIGSLQLTTRARAIADPRRVSRAVGARGAARQGTDGRRRGDGGGRPLSGRDRGGAAGQGGGIACTGARDAG